MAQFQFLLDIKKKTGHIQAGKATIIAFVIMVVFLFMGEGLIKLFGIEVHSFAVAGSFVLFFLALEMILGIQLFKQNEQSLKTAAVMPIAFPIIAGAGSMTTIISIRAEVRANQCAFGNCCKHDIGFCSAENDQKN